MADAMSGEPDGGDDGDGPNQPLPSAAEQADGGDCRGAAARSCEQWRHLERGAASGPVGRRAAAAALSANEAQGGRSSTSTAPPDHRRRLRRARQLRAAGAHPSFLKASLPAMRRKLPCGWGTLLKGKSPNLPRVAYSVFLWEASLLRGIASTTTHHKKGCGGVGQTD